jgi:hypothetical protein
LKWRVEKKEDKITLRRVGKYVVRKTADRRTWLRIMPSGRLWYLRFSVSSVRQFINYFNNLCFFLYSEVQNMCIGCAIGTASGAGGCVHEVALSGHILQRRVS